MTRWLTVAIFAVVIIALAAVLSALVFGLFNRNGSPRTETERDLSYYSTLVASGKANTQNFAEYVDVLIRAGQLSKADNVLNQALSTAKSDKSYLYAQQAQLALARKDYQSTVTYGKQAMDEATKELKAFMSANVANNRRPDAGATMPDSYTTAALAKASAYVATNDWANAVKAYDEYLKFSSTDSDILVLRAQAKVHTGDKTGAAADFRKALEFIPDYQPALDGLKQIGASK